MDGPQIFWNRRQAGIDEFWQDHEKHCGNNQYCKYLDLPNLEYQNDDVEDTEDAPNMGSQQNNNSPLVGLVGDYDEEDQLAGDFSGSQNA